MDELWLLELWLVWLEVLWLLWLLLRLDAVTELSELMLWVLPLVVVQLL